MPQAYAKSVRAQGAQIPRSRRTRATLSPGSALQIVDVKDLDELKAALDKGGYVRMAYDGTPESEDKIKAYTNGGTARCIYKDAPAGTVCPVSGKEAKVIAYFAKAY